VTVCSALLNVIEHCVLMSVVVWELLRFGLVQGELLEINDGDVLQAGSSSYCITCSVKSLKVGL